MGDRPTDDEERYEKFCWNKSKQEILPPVHPSQCDHSALGIGNMISRRLNMVVERR